MVGIHVYNPGARKCRVEEGIKQMGHNLPPSPGVGET